MSPEVNHEEEQQLEKESAGDGSVEASEQTAEESAEGEELTDDGDVAEGEPIDESAADAEDTEQGSADETESETENAEDGSGGRDTDSDGGGEAGAEEHGGELNYQPEDEQPADDTLEGEASPSAEEQGIESHLTEEHPLDMIHELEYAKPAGGEKSKKQKDDEEDSPLTLSSVAEARAVLEGYLFTSNEPLSVQRLSKLMNNLHPRTVRGLLLELQMEYDNRSGALQIVEIAGGFQMSTRPHLADWMFRMHRHKRRSAVSPATLETLAIVAYKQPITKGEVEAIRGVESSGTMRTLQDLNLIEASGRREVLGRPQLFVTTDQFLKAFGLRSLADLPSISELRNLFSSEQKLQAAVAKSEEPSQAADSAEPEAAAAEGTGEVAAEPGEDEQSESETEPVDPDHSSDDAAVESAADDASDDTVSAEASEDMSEAGQASEQQSSDSDPADGADTKTDADDESSRADSEGGGQQSEEADEEHR